MDKYTVNVTDTAFKDLAGITLYISDELKQPAGAEKLIAKIKESIYHAVTS